MALWVKIFHYIDIGHFVWAHPVAEHQDRPRLQWWGTVVANALIGLLAWWRCSRFRSFDPLAFMALPLMIILFFGVRQQAMRLAVKSQGLEVRFRAWESGFPISIAIALVTGFLFPIPGGVYPASTNWSYRDLLPKLGIISLSGVLPILAVTWGVWVLLRFDALSSDIVLWLNFAMQILKPLALFDVVMAFFPFVSFNGRRLWDWNRGAWAVLAVAAVVVFLI